MKKYIYKIDYWEPPESNDYVIRCCEEDYPLAFAKLKGGVEFETDLTENNVGYDIYLRGKEISKKEYDNF